MRPDQLSPLPPGAIGWNVYVQYGGNIDPYVPPLGEPVFVEFVPRRRRPWPMRLLARLAGEHPRTGRSGE